MSTSNEVAASLGDVPSYEEDVPVHAFRFRRGERTVYTISPTIRMALDLLPKPDPSVPFPNNRPIVVPHARAFGDYWESHEQGWGCPPGLVSVREDIPGKWTETGRGNSMTVGTLKLPRSFNLISEILDMQHRLYGWHLKRQELSDKHRKAIDDRNKAHVLGDDLLVQRHQTTVDKIKRQLDRFDQEVLTVEIMVLSEGEHRQLFAKIADEALLINKAQIADYDTSQVINRVAHALAMSHPLLLDRVDWVKTNMSDSARQSNKNLMSGDTLANIVRPFATGMIVGRVTLARNVELAQNEASIVTQVSTFLDVLAAGFDHLGLVMAERMTPRDLREMSLLGSRTVLRVLAAAYSSLTATRDAKGKPVVPRMTREQVLTYFKELSPHFGLPLEASWLTLPFFPAPEEPEPGAVAKEVRAPSSRNQDLKAFADSVVLWAMEPSKRPFK